MIGEALFVGGLLKLAAGVRQRLSDADFEAYDVIRKEGTDADWNGYVSWALEEREFPERFPKLDELRESFGRWKRDSRPALPGKVGKCEACDGTSWDRYERDGVEYVRPCPACRPAMVSA